MSKLYTRLPTNFNLKYRVKFWLNTKNDCCTRTNKVITRVKEFCPRSFLYQIHKHPTITLLCRNLPHGVITGITLNWLMYLCYLPTATEPFKKPDTIVRHVQIINTWYIGFAGSTCHEKKHTNQFICYPLQCTVEHNNDWNVKTYVNVALPAASIHLIEIPVLILQCLTNVYLL